MFLEYFYLKFINELTVDFALTRPPRFALLHLT